MSGAFEVAFLIEYHVAAIVQPSSIIRLKAGKALLDHSFAYNIVFALYFRNSV